MINWKEKIKILLAIFSWNSVIPMDRTYFMSLSKTILSKINLWIKEVSINNNYSNIESFELYIEICKILNNILNVLF